LFARARRWLVDGGVALFTAAAIPSDTQSELFTDLEGAPTFYDAWTAETTLRLVEAAGFTVEDYDVPDLRDQIGDVLMVLLRAR
jgi:hypothetical protein